MNHLHYSSTPARSLHGSLGSLHDLTLEHACIIRLDVHRCYFEVKYLGGPVRGHCSASANVKLSNCFFNTVKISLKLALKSIFFPVSWCEMRNVHWKMSGGTFIRNWLDHCQLAIAEIFSQAERIPDRPAQGHPKHWRGLVWVKRR